MHSFRLPRMVAAALTALAALPAAAHSPYLLPNYFDATDRDHVSVQASFTERFFVPDITMKADYHVLSGEGVRTPLTPQYSRDLAVVDVDTRVPGTYRISTGLREGSTRKAALIDGRWEFFERGDAPANAVDMQSWTRADVYVSRGSPTDAVLAPTGTGLEFHLLTHPNRLFAGKGARLLLLFDGKPLANGLVQLQLVGDPARDVAPPVELHSDARGQLELPLQAAGLYYLMSRHRVGPQAAGSTGRSYTMGLTLEVTE